MANVMLTTIDNPFNPFTDWDAWKGYDEAHKYYTCEYLARITTTADDLTDADYDAAIDAAIDEIVKFNINGLYTKIYENESVGTPGGGS